MRPGELEEAFHDAIDAIELVGNHSLERARESACRRTCAARAREGLKRAERILDLVRESCGEGPERREPVRPSELRLELVDDRDVLEDPDDAELLALAAAQRGRAQLDGQEVPVPSMEREGHVGGSALLPSVSMRCSTTSGLCAKTSGQYRPVASGAKSPVSISAAGFIVTTRPSRSSVMMPLVRESRMLSV